tara:strand:- start:8729 stop:9271 length:543 start_codon:yes stop_codon:yes gene_type:complete
VATQTWLKLRTLYRGYLYEATEEKKHITQPKRNEPMRFENSIEIERPVEDVFAFISVQENHPAFIPQNKKSTQLTDGPMRVGAVVQNEAQFMGMNMTETFEITEFVPNKVIAKRSHEGSTVETTDRFELEALSNNKTKVTMIVTGNPKGLQKLFFALTKPFVKRSFPDILNRLKNVLEDK